MSSIKKAMRHLAVFSISILVLNILFTAVGITVSSLNSATANLSSYVDVARLAGVISPIRPLLDFIHIIGGIVVLLEMFGADALLQIS